MLQQLRKLAARIVMGVAFFIFGFFVVANALELTPHQIMVGLAAGTIAGVTVLIAVICEERKAGYSAGAPVS
jgi:hypothetical protein